MTTDVLTYFDHLDQTQSIPQDSILSQTILDTPSLRWVLFHFASGQELSEHTASFPAVIQIIRGEARLVLGNEVREAAAGATAYMPAFLKHAVYAKTPLVMLLQLVKIPKV